MTKKVHTFILTERVLLRMLSVLGVVPMVFAKGLLLGTHDAGSTSSLGNWSNKARWKRDIGTFLRNTFDLWG